MGSGACRCRAGPANCVPSQRAKPTAATKGLLLVPLMGKEQHGNRSGSGGCHPTSSVGACGRVGERVRGAARGAAGGAAIGAIAGDAGKGAAIGAVGGTMVGGSRARQNQRAAAANQQAQSQGAIDTFNRAYAACMEGRGYTIK